MLVVPRQRNTPRKTGAADTEVKEALLDKANDFVHSVIGNNAAGVVGIPLQKTIAIARQAEEIVFFFNMLDGLFVNGAIAVNKIVFSEVSLARHAIQTAVLVELDVAAVVTRLQKLLHSDAVALFGCANEVVIADVEFLPCVSEKRGDGIGECLRSHAGSIGGLLNLETVLVGAS